MAGNTAIGYVNYFKTGTLTANSSVSGLAAANLSSDQCSPSTGWQTANGVLTQAAGALLRCDSATAGVSWRLFGLFNTNLTSSATVNVVLWQNPGPTQVWGTTVLGPQTGYRQVIIDAGQDYTGDFVQIVFNDPTNPDNHINIGGAFAGPAWFPLTGISWDTAYGSLSTQQKTVSRGGQEYRNLLYRQRSWKLALGGVRDSEAWDDLGELDRIASLGGNVLFVPDVTSVDLYREAVFGPLDAQANVTFPTHVSDRRSWSATVTERL